MAAAAAETVTASPQRVPERLGRVEREERLQRLAPLRDVANDEVRERNREQRGDQQRSEPEEGRAAEARCPCGGADPTEGSGHSG